MNNTLNMENIMFIKHLESREVETMPEFLEDGIIYISRKYETAIHLCACGCKEQTVTPFNKPYGWTLTDDKDGVTLRPSIGNQNMSCKSHYFITNGKVENCG